MIFATIWARINPWIPHRELIRSVWKHFGFWGFRTRFPSKSWCPDLAPRDNFDGFQAEIDDVCSDSTKLICFRVVLIAILISFQLNMPEILLLRAKIIDWIYLLRERFFGAPGAFFKSWFERAMLFTLISDKNKTLKQIKSWHCVCFFVPDHDSFILFPFGSFGWIE